ncbi:MAG: FAD-linked oxidase C-terminal domain-containing protein [Acidobacteriota bacterium]
MISRENIDEIKKIFGEERCLNDELTLQKYSSDETKISFIPDLVVFPSSTEEISMLMKIANREKIPVTPRGAGTGYSGGAIAVRGGVILSLEKMNRILSIDPENLIGVVEPGVITEHFHKEVEKYGLCYPPDPASLDKSTIGGNLAENAGGPRCFRYGVTRNYVLGTKAVLPDGEIIKTGSSTIKNVVGYDLTHLLIGSEGTLAIVTEIILRLVPLPPNRTTLRFGFDSYIKAANFISEIIREKVFPSSLEFMDELSIKYSSQYLNIKVDEKIKAFILTEIDGELEAIEKIKEKILAVSERYSPLEVKIPKDKKEEEDIWIFRKNVSSAINMAKPKKYNQDIVVPRMKIPEILEIINEIGKKYKILTISFGHAGDGNIHTNFMIDDSNPEEVENVEKAINELFNEVIKLGGVISGEHGIGITKSRFINLQLSPLEIEIMKKIKKVFDPNGILNPGKIFPLF